MKIRNGFVSNSSSSSFIIGIAKVNDLDKVNNWIKENEINIDTYNVGLKQVKDINSYCIHNDGNKLSIDSFMYSGVELEYLSPEDLVFYFDFTYGDDSDFYNDEYYDYDIDLDFFPDRILKHYNGLTEENGFTNIDTTYGAGRNG